MWCGWPPPSFDPDLMIFTTLPIPRLYRPPPPGKSITSHQRANGCISVNWEAGVSRVFFSGVSRRPSVATNTNNRR